MSQYRDDLEAARHRIETLEAKLREREASLEVREAELAERRAEVERLRRRGGGPEGEGRVGALSRGRVAVVLTIGAVVAVVMVGIMVGVLSFRGASDPGDVAEAPAPVWPAPLQPEPPKSFEPPAPLPTPPAPLPTATAEPSNVAMLREAVNVSRPDIRRCYERELVKRPDASGTVRVTIEVGEKGGVRSVSLGESAVRSAALDACLIKVFKGIEIPGLEGGATTVTYPLVFTASAKDPFAEQF